MNTSREYKGIFWINGEQDNWKNGILKFLDGIAYVDLFGSFDKDPLNNESERREEICCIHGRLDNQHYCVLTNCEVRITNPFFLTTLINLELLYFASSDKLFDKRLNFERVRFNLDYLAAWRNYKGLETFWDEDNKVKGVRRKSQKYEPVELLSNDDYLLSINNYTSVPVINSSLNYTLEQETYLFLDIKSDINTSDLFIYVDKIQDLFILMVGDRVTLHNPIRFYDSDNNEYGCFRNISRFRFTKKFSDRWYFHNLLFSFEDLNNIGNIEGVFSNWISLYKSYEYPIELLIKCLSDISMNQESKFINLMYALDVIQKKDLYEMFKETINISDQEKKVLEKLQNDYKHDSNTFNFIKTKFEKRKSVKLKDKFERLLTPYSDLFVLLFNEDFDDFLILIVNTRNFLAHENNAEPRITQNQMHLYNSKLEAILILIFFEKLEISLEKIEKQIKKHKRFQEVIKGK